MKQTISLLQIVRSLFFALLFIQTISSCKKDSHPTPKDYSTSIKTKTWWGQITYSGQTAEYYSVHFNADNTLLWSQLSGDYTGKWSIADKTISLSFDASPAVIKASITEDDKFFNISDNTGYYEINSGQIVSNPDMVLDNTIWKGSAIIILPIAYQLNFLTGNKLDTKKGTTTTGPYTYTRSASGGAIRIKVSGTEQSFGVITSSTEMKGSYNDASAPWSLTKQ